MFEILQYSFFQNALIWWILIALIAGISGVFIIMRKEANITHSISNFLFLGIAISLILNGNYYVYAFLFAIIASIVIYFIEHTGLITKESTKEIISQTGMAWAIFTLWFLDTLTLDINNFLFWSILFISEQDIYIMGVLFLFIYLFWFLFGRNFLAVIINEDIAVSRGIKVSIYNLVFLLFLSLFIGMSIKIFWVLLIGAFLVIPANIGKILGNYIRSVFIISLVSAFSWVILWLFSSYFLWTSTWATIVLYLIWGFLIALILKSTKWKR